MGDGMDGCLALGWGCLGMVRNNTVSPLKFNIAPKNYDGWRLLSYWEGNFSGAMLNFGRVNPHYGWTLPSSRGKIRTFNSFMVQLSRFARQVLGEMPSESWDCWVLQELLSTNSFSAEGKPQKKHWNRAPAELRIGRFISFLGPGRTWQVLC